MPSPAVAADGRTRYALAGGVLRVERGGSVREVRLDDPARPEFADLPAIDLDDGRPLRRAAFEVWARAVRAAVEGGASYEAQYRAPRPVVTGLTMLGAATVCGLCSLLLWTWAFRPRAPVTVEPTPVESLGLLAAVVLVVGVIALAAAALVRAWRCRRGSYVHVGAQGLRTRHGGRTEPLAAVAAADWHPFVRCTRIAFADGRPDVWVPAESGALRRADLLLAALDDRLGAAVR